MSGVQENLNLKEYFEQVVQDELKIFDEFIRWTDKDKREFEELLTKLKSPFDKATETTKEKGDRLEKVVEFIIQKSFFLEIFKNIHTETNEIDEVIVFSNRGKQALHSFNISRELIPIEENIMLGECKNYSTNLGVTYVGKFYSLMTVSGVSFGILFTQNGLTGDAEGYKDAYGLTKVLRMIEKSREPGKEFFILTFTLEDYEKLLQGYTFFELIKAKRLEMQFASDYNNFISDNRHDAENEIKKAISEIIR